MAYLRTKKINENLYCYLVENKQTQQGPRQKVKKYLGKAISLSPEKEVKFEGGPRKNKKDLLLELVKWELSKHGFKEKQNLFVKKEMYFDLNRLTLKNKHKEAVLRINEGFLCRFTLQRILTFKKTNELDEDALRLAKYFVEAGINIPKDTFVEFYQKNS